MSKEDMKIDIVNKNCFFDTIADIVIPGYKRSNLKPGDLVAFRLTCGELRPGELTDKDLLWNVKDLISGVEHYIDDANIEYIAAGYRNYSVVFYKLDW